MSRYQVLSESDAQEMYDDLLDQDGPVTIAGIQFDPSYALRELDPIAYDVGFRDFVSSLEEDGIYVEGLPSPRMTVNQTKPKSGQILTPIVDLSGQVLVAILPSICIIQTL